MRDGHGGHKKNLTFLNVEKYENEKVWFKPCPLCPPNPVNLIF